MSMDVGEEMKVGGGGLVEGGLPIDTKLIEVGS